MGKVLDDKAGFSAPPAQTVSDRAPVREINIKLESPSRLVAVKSKILSGESKPVYISPPYSVAGGCSCDELIPSPEE